MYIHGYELAEDVPTFRVPENFDRYNEGSGWQAYRGGNDWENGTTGVAVYLNPEGYQKEMARIWFEVKFPPHLEEYVSSNKGWNTPSSKAVKKWGDKAARRWMRETVNIRRATKKLHGPHDGYNHTWMERKSWRECFLLALEAEKMKPFVKKFGVDRTKWIGMKRSTTLNESGMPSKYWWMDPNGELIPVPYDGHAVKGAEIIKNKTGRISLDVYPDMYKLGYIRVGFAGMWGQYLIEINYGQKPPSLKQWKALKDLAIETGADTIRDDTRKKEVRVDECRLLFENFHENKEWFLYEGENTITAVFGDNTRQTFKVHYRNNRIREDQAKHRAKAARTWKRLAMEIRKSAGLSKSGNPVVVPWQECFERALKDPMMLEFVDDLRATPIFEYFQPMQNLWLAPDGKVYRGGSHEHIAQNILYLLGKKVDSRDHEVLYGALWKLGYARIILHGFHDAPLIVDKGTEAAPRLTKAQRKWVEDMSFELGLNGEYSNAYGRTITLESELHEMTYDELHQSMQDFRTRKDLRKGTVTGADSRERGAKSVNVRSLRVVSTVGRDGGEHETSLFSYKTRPSSDDPRSQHPRWNGYIRFIEDSKGGAVAPTKDKQDVEVNCNCPDYRYVWAKANSDADAGVTGREGGMKQKTQGTAGKPVNIFEAEVAPAQDVEADKRFKGGGNANNGTYGKRIRNPQNTPGLCKHLIALANYIEKGIKSEPVAPAEPDKEEPDVVAKPSKLKKTGKPVNIFETIKQFALDNPTFDVTYDD